MTADEYLAYAEQCLREEPGSSGQSGLRAQAIEHIRIARVKIPAERKALEGVAAAVGALLEEWDLNGVNRSGPHTSGFILAMKSCREALDAASVLPAVTR